MDGGAGLFGDGDGARFVSPERGARARLAHSTINRLGEKHRIGVNYAVRWLFHAVLLVVVLGGAAVQAAEIPQFGAGVVLGVPFGLTAKYWFNARYALQSHLGVSDGNLMLNADFLKNFNQVLPRKVPGTRLPLYAGLGLKLKTERDTFIGIRFVGGVSLFHSKKPIEFFAEVAPVLRLLPSEGGTFNGAVGVRRYF